MAAGAATAVPPVLGGYPAGSHFDFEVWQRKLESRLYYKMQFIPRIDEGDRGYSVLHIRKSARFSTNAMSSTSPGWTNASNQLTYNDPAPTEVTVIPAGIYCAVAWTANESASTEVPLDAEMANDMENSMAEGNETNALANITGASTFIGDGTYNIDAAGFRNVAARIRNATYGNYAAEKGKEQVYGILHVAQEPYLLSIPEFNNAYIRGDDENPNVNGLWSKGNNIMVMLTNLLLNDANGAHGCFWVRSAFVASWNVRAMFERQMIELQRRLILFNHVGYQCKNPERAIECRTSSTIPSVP